MSNICVILMLKISYSKYIFHCSNPSGHTMTLGELASKRNECQKCSWGVKAAGV